ncbi:uncharacterized protein LOC116032976 [Ipomoea triloba]|uniref:uncharacterized protein LOC116032976 n=1 Tax=Ipomoea triloba TaxID=35885 RepID=UPI00125D25DC|nr:uncharacterized protein LOC116032976 [Ipomoea triloba]
MKLALSHGYTSIIVETDSEVVINVFVDDTYVSHSKDTLISDGKFLIRQFRNFKMVHVLQEGNQCADFLAHCGQSSTWGTTILDELPEGLTPLLDCDALKVSFRRIR